MIQVGSLVSFRYKESIEKYWLGLVIDITDHGDGSDVLVHWSTGQLWSHQLSSLSSLILD